MTANAIAIPTPMRILNSAQTGQMLGAVGSTTSLGRGAWGLVVQVRRLPVCSASRTSVSRRRSLVSRCCSRACWRSFAHCRRGPCWLLCSGSLLRIVAACPGSWSHNERSGSMGVKRMPCRGLRHRSPMAWCVATDPDGWCPGPVTRSANPLFRSLTLCSVRGRGCPHSE